MRIFSRFNYHRLACLLALCVLLFAYQFTNLFDIVFYLASRETYELPLSLRCNLGRLGNQMCTYATLFGVSALNHRRRFIPLSCNVKHLRGIFVGPSKVPSIHKNLYFKLHPWNVTSYLRPKDAAIPQNSNYLDGYGYPCSYTFFDHVREELRREFQFEDHLVQHARNILLKANALDKPNVTYVSIHVRRGDYIKGWLGVYDGVPVNMEYFKITIEYFRNKYENVVFIAVSDDRLWCIRHLSTEFGVYVPEDAPSPAHDLAVLANCNHSILSYGTFGFWGAYLAGGEVLYFDKYLKPNTTFTREKFVFDKMYPPRWKGIVTVDISRIFSPNNRTVNNQTVTVVKV